MHSAILFQVHVSPDPHKRPWFSMYQTLMRCWSDFTKLSNTTSDSGKYDQLVNCDVQKDRLNGPLIEIRNFKGGLKLYKGGCILAFDYPTFVTGSCSERSANWKKSYNILLNTKIHSSLEYIYLLVYVYWFLLSFSFFLCHQICSTSTFFGKTKIAKQDKVLTFGFRCQTNFWLFSFVVDYPLYDMIEEEGSQGEILQCSLWSSQYDTKKRGGGDWL